MCGLTGIFRSNRAPVSSTALRQMTDTLAHRGPDGEGLWTGEGIGLGHRRLAIIDPSPAGRQPMQTPDGRYTLVFNGTIYNFRELRVQLQARGHLFRSQSDTEVLLYAFAEWGLDCVNRLNGMFAFAIWDATRHTLSLARDRYGIKPLYYSQHGSTFLFGSEVKALIAHPKQKVRVSRSALQEYFTFQNIFSDQTLFDGVTLLPAGHTLTIEAGAAAPTIRQYWDYHFEDDDTLSKEDCVSEVSRLFEQAVSRQLVADVDIGTYLSGGVDSGAITCLTARNIPHVRSFTCGFDLNSASGLEMSFDERAKAEYLSYLFKTEHYEVVLKAGDMERVMGDLVWHLEDLRVGQSYPNYYVAGLASRFVKVVMSGTGGDELFAGYPWRYAHAALANEGVDDFVDRYFKYWQRLVPDDKRQHLFRGQVDPDLPARVFHGVYGDRLRHATTDAEFVNHSLYFETKTFLHGLLLVEDKLSMAHGLETRVPFLDNDLVDFAQRVPVRYKLRDIRGTEPRLNENLMAEKHARRTNDGKLVLREVFERFVPRDYARAVKQGFSAPDGSWFKGESVDYIKRLLSRRSARLYEYLDPSTVQGLLADHFDGHTNRRLFIWSCLCFEWWLQRFDPESAV